MNKFENKLEKMITGQGGFLIGWKSIGDFLGVSERTVQRNWKKWGLPIFFLNSYGKTSPAIHVADIEAWKRMKIEETYQLRKEY